MVDVKTFDNFPYYFLLKMHCYYGKHSLKLKHYSATICARIRAIPLSDLIFQCMYLFSQRFEAILPQRTTEE